MYNLNATVKLKSALDINSLALTLIYHWGKDTSVFLNKRQ